jgi:hypothetical protein
MRLDPKPAPTTRDCKLKRVYPRLPLHVHSAAQKRLAGTAAGNPGRHRPATSTSESCLDEPRNRLDDGLSSASFARLESAASVRGRSVDDVLEITLAAAS